VSYFEFSIEINAKVHSHPCHHMWQATFCVVSSLLAHKHCWAGLDHFKQ